VIAIAVVVVPRQLPIHEGLQFMHQKESLFKEARKFAAEHQVMLETDCVIAHHTHDGIITAAERYRADLLVMGWKGHTDTRGRIFGEVADHVIRHAPCDLILFKSSGQERFQKCLLPTAGGPHARLAVDFINILARPLQMSVTAGYVVPIGATTEVQVRGAKWIEKTLLHIDKSLQVDKKLIESGSVAEGIEKESQDFDLVVIGAAREPLFRKALIGDIPEKVARHSSASVLVVKRYEGTVKSLLKKTFG
jgi:nucleotide-binding universal stress UspA family protein